MLNKNTTQTNNTTTHKTGRHPAAQNQAPAAPAHPSTHPPRGATLARTVRDLPGTPQPQTTQIRDLLERGDDAGGVLGQIHRLAALEPRLRHPNHARNLVGSAPRIRAKSEAEMGGRGARGSRVRGGIRNPGLL